MNQFAIIFPGLGTYNIKVLEALFKKHNIIRQTFTEASDILHNNIYKDFIINASDPLYYKKNIYLIIFISSIAIYRTLNKEIDINPGIMGGHSLGQYSALVCNNNILFQEALKIIKIRNQIMLLAVKNIRILNLIILGLNYNIVKRICTSVSTTKKKYLSLLLTQKNK
ncbi:ACP S-malonyltransferase [Buchnera aphidicola]|uniref:ACP S-malonyltransferase n=1 Tax=Buchnera aphidicola TaxID=9 RepID=UPI00094C1536|nr:ACP S-malonyltransferase [Buchnera aphidicola]